MATLLKKYTNQKLLGQIYTPHFIVEKMLHDIGYEGKSIIGKTILEPACGEGNFLIVVAEKIIALSPPETLKENLEKIHGWDIDEMSVKACIANLNALIQDLPIQVNWQIAHCNALEKIRQTKQKFDFIVGNPPYIRVQNLSEKERAFIQDAYQFCQRGCTDIYIAFYELCNAILAKEGICALITPNTFFYTEAAHALRTYFAKEQTIIQITNYGDIQLFENVTTYSTIMIFGKKKRAHFLYECAVDTQHFAGRNIDFQEIKDQKTWRLGTESPTDKQVIKLKDICKIHAGLTTLADRVFILREIKECVPWDEAGEIVEMESRTVGKIRIEKGILKPLVKASRIKKSTDSIREYVIFPYERGKKKHQIIPEARLQTTFPLAYQYLLSLKDTLIKRDNGKPNPMGWYAFGRSQGLETSFGKKILFSPLNRKPNFILHENEECTFYSGYCIKYDGDYNFLLQQLNSERLANFVAISARDFRGGWKAYNKKTLEEFGIEAS